MKRIFSSYLYRLINTILAVIGAAWLLSNLQVGGWVTAGIATLIGVWTTSYLVNASEIEAEQPDRRDAMTRYRDELNKRTGLQ